MAAAYLPKTKMAEMFGIEYRGNHCSCSCIHVLFLLNLKNLRDGVTYTSTFDLLYFPFMLELELE